MSISSLQTEISKLNNLLNNQSDTRNYLFLRRRNYLSLRGQLIRLNDLNIDEYEGLRLNSLAYLNFLFDLNGKLIKTKASDISTFKSIIETAKLPTAIQYTKIESDGTETVNTSFNIKDISIFGNVILSVLYQLAVNSQLPNQSIYFLPQAGNPTEVKKFTKNVFPSNKLVTDYSTISSTLKNIANIVDNLKVPEPQEQSTTPTAVANSSIKKEQDLIKEYKSNQSNKVYLYTEVNEEFLDNYNSLPISKGDSDFTNKPLLIKGVEVFNKHISLITKYRTNILDSKRVDNTESFYTPQDIDNTVNSLNKRINILRQLLKISKGSSQDTKTNDLKVPSLPTTDNSSNSTPTTTDNTPKSTSDTTTEKTKPTTTKSEVPLTPEQWGIKFTVAGASTAPKLGKKDPFSPLFGPNAEVAVPQNTFYMDLLPARQSTIPVQGGRDVPNAMPGLNYKLIPAVGKQQIPGFSPVYQNLGIKGMQVTIVGAFTGNDGASRGTDTPDPKSRFWSNAKGSPTLADNPGRGNILSEATAYNSYTEFVQLCHEGKHMEVEINLFQVYQTSTATEIGEKVKLQSKTGNPKFTGVVRSLDVYHQTKERTWYTLVMDVTDFGMASKTPINLNNKLQEAIETARQQLEQAQAQAEAAKEEDEINAATIPGEPELSNDIFNIKQRILNLKDNTQKTKQLAIYDHLLEHIKVLKNKDNYALKKYNGGQPWTTFVTNLGSYSDASFFPISNSQILLRIRLDCRVLVGIQGTCNSELYWLLDGTEGNTKPITKFLGNGTRQSTFLMFPKETRQRISNDPFGFGPHSEDDGKESQRNSLLSQAKNLTNAERGALTIKAIGCLAIGAVGTGLATVGTAGGALAPGIAATLGTCAVSTSAYAYEKYDTLNKNEAQWSNAVWGELAMELLITLGTVGVVRGGGALLSTVTKQGSTVAKSATQTVVNQVDDIAARLSALDDNSVLIKKRITVNNGNADEIINVVNVRTGSNGQPIIVGSNSQTYTYSQVKSVPDSVFNQPTVTTNVPNNNQQPSIVLTLDEQIDNIPNLPNKTYVSLKSLSNSQKTKVVTTINQIKSVKSDAKKVIKIQLADGTTFDYKPSGTRRFLEEGIEIRQGQTDILIKYEDIVDSRIVDIAPSPSQQTTTQPPSQTLVPDNQTNTGISQTNPVQNPPVPSPVGLTGQAKANYDKLLPFNNKQLSNGKFIIVKLKDGKILNLKNIRINNQNNPILEYTETSKVSFIEKILGKVEYEGYAEATFDEIIEIILP